MASYTIEVEPNVTAQLTGRLGTAVVIYRGHEYRVALGGPEMTRDGHPVGLDVLPQAVYAFAAWQFTALRTAAGAV